MNTINPILLETAQYALNLVLEKEAFVPPQAAAQGMPPEAPQGMPPGPEAGAVDPAIAQALAQAPAPTPPPESSPPARINADEVRRLIQEEMSRQQQPQAAGKSKSGNGKEQMSAMARRLKRIETMMAHMTNAAGFGLPPNILDDDDDPDNDKAQKQQQEQQAKALQEQQAVQSAIPPIQAMSPAMVTGTKTAGTIDQVWCDMLMHLNAAEQRRSSDAT